MGDVGRGHPRRHRGGRRAVVALAAAPAHRALARQPAARGEVRHGRRHHPGTPWRRRARVPHQQLRHPRQPLLQRLPHLRGQRRSAGASRYGLLQPGEQARGKARHAELPRLPRPQAAQGSGQDGVLDVGRARQGNSSHAKVPRNVCERCHVTGDAKKTWQAIAATAGHRTHLESDSSSLKGKVECLTCHAQTAHRFKPANSTCAQSGCHAAETVRIRLGRMASQTSQRAGFVCHKFTAEVPALATRDSAANTLIPKSEQCFSCHQMRGRLAEFAPGQDPHNATCGMCHDPHKQQAPIAAAATCSTAGCHGDWKKVPFHTGAAHRRVAEAPERCITCHLPHQARVDGSDCAGCHAAVRERPGGKLHPPLPFDTTVRSAGYRLGRPHPRPRHRRTARRLSISRGPWATGRRLTPGPRSRSCPSASRPPRQLRRPIRFRTCRTDGCPVSPATLLRASAAHSPSSARAGARICHHQAPSAAGVPLR